MTKKNEKRSFVMYDSFLEAMKHLNDSEFRECVMKIRDYALEGIDEESQSPYVNIILALAKPNLDAARRRYMTSVENGKKGAEFGKLGGAPKGNQNARKKQPQKQPLDVDANEDVEEDVNNNEEVNENANADEADPSGAISVKSSFSNSSIGFSNKEIVNDSERLKEREETKEPCSEERPLSSNDLEVDVASEEKGKSPIYSNSDNSNSASSPSLSDGAVGSAARSRQQKEPGMDMSEYLEQCIYKNAIKLAHIRKNELPNDDKLFWRTVDFCCDLNGDSKDKATKFVTDLVNEIIRQNVV